MATPSRRPWRRPGALVVVASVAVTALLLGHRLVPNRIGRLGSLLETFLPWLGLAVPVLLFFAVRRRSRGAALAVLLPVVAWAALFGGLLLTPRATAAGTLTVVQHNVSDQNPDPAGTAETLAGAGPDLIALEELTPTALPAYRRALAAQYPHHAVFGSVGLWSRHPLSDARELDIRPTGITDPDWRRGLRATVRTPHGDLAVYVAHLPSMRLGPTGLGSGRRDGSARRLAAALDTEKLHDVVLLGDLNGTLDDRGLRPLTSRLTPARSRFDFSWPSSVRLARIDQIMSRGLRPISTSTLPATGSDHLPVLARLGR
ncbi:endonuclease/exonuclease/phosphatase family protein [Kitasatospora sp. NPDC096147]|uniref:endonuclease/exonuclease/phosphatase family protein n=1 Tax=Kitasatospora sp. NPDC096147 TaxID=3364093 RepID=UPI00380A8718